MTNYLFLIASISLSRRKQHLSVSDISALIMILTLFDVRHFYSVL